MTRWLWSWSTAASIWPEPVRLTICVPMRWKRFMTRSRASSSDSSSQRSSTNSGAIPQAPTIQAARSVAACTSPPTPVEFSP